MSIDVSFISVRLILPVLPPLLTPGASVLAMVKPQFEVGRGRVGKGGVVRTEELRQAAVDGVSAVAKTLGLIERGRIDNQVTGPKGNREVFLHLCSRL